MGEGRPPMLGRREDLDQSTRGRAWRGRRRAHRPKLYRLEAWSSRIAAGLAAGRRRAADLVAEGRRRAPPATPASSTGSGWGRAGLELDQVAELDRGSAWSQVAELHRGPALEIDQVAELHRGELHRPSFTGSRSV